MKRKMIHRDDPLSPSSCDVLREKKWKQQPTFSSVICVEKRKLACLCCGVAAATPCQCTEMVFISWIPTVEVSQQKATWIPPDKWLDIVLHLPAHFSPDYPPRISLSSSVVVVKLFPCIAYFFCFTTSISVTLNTGMLGKYRCYLNWLWQAECQSFNAPLHSWPAMLRCSKAVTAALTIHTELDDMRNMTGTHRWESERWSTGQPHPRGSHFLP